MKETSKEVVLELNLPEFSRKDIKVNIKKNSLQVKAEKKTEKKVQKKGYYHEEKTSRVFSYFTTIPTIDPKKAKVSFKKGVLKISSKKA